MAASEHQHPDDHGHEHHHRVDVAALRASQRRVLHIVLLANAAFFGVELVGAFAFHSLSLLADAGHLLSDVAGIGVALVAARLLEQPASPRHTYGLQRAEVLAAQANGVTLLAVCGWIVFTALRRIGEPVEVSGGGLVVVATIGLVINIGSAVLLARARGESLNMRGAYIHMVTDAAGSAAAIVAGLAVSVWGADWADPIASLAIAALVLWSTWGLLRDATLVLLEGTPRGIDAGDVEAVLRADPEVEAVHHLHVWSLASDVAALSAHVVLRGELTLHEAQSEGERLKLVLEHELGITHSTLELECHPCDPVDDHVDRIPESSRHDH